MDEGNKCIAFLKEYRAHPERYLPMVNHQYKHFDEWENEIVRNMCWDAGILEDNRPYFMECWKVFSTTSITVLISAKGIEHWQNEMLFLLKFIEAGLITEFDKDNLNIKVKKYAEENGNEFFSVNLVLGVDEKGQFIRWGRGSETFEALNRLNDETGGEG